MNIKRYDSIEHCNFIIGAFYAFSMFISLLLDKQTICIIGKEERIFIHKK